MKGKLIGAALLINFFISCEKDKTPSAPVATTGSYSSYATLTDFELTPTYVIRYYFMDLAGDNNSNKKYFKARVIDVLTDSMEIVEGPYSLDSLLAPAGLPASITSASSGSWLTDFINKDSIRVRQLSSVNGKRSFTTQPWLGYGMVGGMNVGSIIKNVANGKQIEGHTQLDRINVPKAGGGGYVAKDLFFFFSQGKCVVGSEQDNTLGALTPPGTAQNITDVLPGADAFDWKSVNNYFSYYVGGSAYAHIFIDYKNWRYFKLKEVQSSVGANTVWTLEWYGYKSLDKLLKWPRGWKKG